MYMKINKVLIFVISISVFLLGLLLGLSLNEQEGNRIPDTQIISNKSCDYNGRTYKSGEGFTDIDGCNSCSCENGNIACTLMACEQD